MKAAAGNGILTGSPAFVLGNGPSLPVDDLSCLRGCFTVGVNRILRSGFTPTVIVWADRTVYQDDGEQMDASEALLVCDARRVRRPEHIGLKTWVGDHALTHDGSPIELTVNGSTGCCAARWAIALGCQPVYLVGMGATYRGEQTDFYGRNRHHHGGSTLAVLKKELARLQHDHGEDILPIYDGQTLCEFAAESPQFSQDEYRAAVHRVLSFPRPG